MSITTFLALQLARVSATHPMALGPRRPDLHQLDTWVKLSKGKDRA
jgi:hypothetical protein